MPGGVGGAAGGTRRLYPDLQPIGNSLNRTRPGIRTQPADCRDQQADPVRTESLQQATGPQVRASVRALASQTLRISLGC